MVPTRSVMVPIRSVAVHLAKKCFQDCVVYCLLPPTLVYFAVLKPRLLSVYCLIHCTTTRTTSDTLLICLQCNQSCHQFVAKHTLISFITDLGYFVSWGKHNDQTCISLLDACISEFLTNAPAHADKHIIMTRKKGDFVRNLCCIFDESRVFGYRPLSKPGLFIWTIALKHSKVVFCCEWL